jgi:hypothetical protein
MIGGICEEAGMKARHARWAAAAMLVLATVCGAAIRGPGKYCGVVTFDRWGGCILYSGVYVMYVSEAVKEPLRAQAGKAVQLDATDVFQPWNPGDGLIRKFTLLGPAPEGTDYVVTAGVTLSARAAFKDGEAPAVVIRAQNTGDAPVTLYMEELAPTLLTTRGERDWGPADGPYAAVLTRQAFRVAEEMRMKGGNDRWAWTVKSPEKLEPTVTLPAKGSFEITLTYAVPPGEYDFIAGYGGGVHASRCVASNLVAFDVGADGKGKLVAVKGR